MFPSSVAKRKDEGTRSRSAGSRWRREVCGLAPQEGSSWTSRRGPALRSGIHGASVGVAFAGGRVERCRRLCSHLFRFGRLPKRSPSTTTPLDAECDMTLFFK